jgi:tetratricopeptide (TPR) repeat protein
VIAHPRAVRDCAEDLEEVRAMIAAGEADVAIDELRWLLGTCHDMIEAHFLLGQLAVEVDNDVALGRGHFGTGYQLGLQAWRRADRPQPLVALHPANRHFFDAGRGLAWCLHELGKSDMAREVLQQLLALDPSDPLGVGSWLDEIDTAGKTVVGIDTLFKSS